MLNISISENMSTCVKYILGRQTIPCEFLISFPFISLSLYRTQGKSKLKLVLYKMILYCISVDIQYMLYNNKITNKIIQINGKHVDTTDL